MKRSEPDTRGVSVPYKPLCVEPELLFGGPRSTFLRMVISNAWQDYEVLGGDGYLEREGGRYGVGWVIHSR